MTNQHKETDISSINHKIDVWDSEPSPCTGCEHAKLCALSNLACTRFYVYTRLFDVEDGDYYEIKGDLYHVPEVRVPSRKIYNKIYRFEDRINTKEEVTV